MKYVTCIFDTLYQNNLRNISFYSFPMYKTCNKRIVCYGIIKENKLYHFIKTYPLLTYNKLQKEKFLTINNAILKCFVLGIINCYSDKDNNIKYNCSYSNNTSLTVKIWLRDVL